MKSIDNKTKEKMFRFPSSSPVGFGRKLTSLQTAQGFWVASQMESDGKNTIVAKRFANGKSAHGIMESDALCHQPFLFGDAGEVCMVWNENRGERWRIRIARLTSHGAHIAFTDLETVHESTELCLPPAAAFFRGSPWVVWAGIGDDGIRIRLARRLRNGRWEAASPISSVGVEAFRPVVKASAQRLFVVWDQYLESRYEIAGWTTDAHESAAIPARGFPGERWLCPDLAVSADGKGHLCWSVLREVMDDRGILDHEAFVMVGTIHGATSLEIITDSGAAPRRWVADLREGLLPKRIYKGYLGLRRQPRIAVQDGVTPWCFWEVRIEDEATAVCGHLAARKCGDDVGSAPLLIANAGYGYSVPDAFQGSTAPAAFFWFSGKGLGVLCADTFAMDCGTPHPAKPVQWDSWRPCPEPPPLVKNQRPIETGGKVYRMFWTDTHCHSNFSPDAEGEPDEIIHFGRDVAGLDALCVIDNDYYPHKALTEVEWRIHEAFSRYFTREGTFVLFPGYEFTYHRADLSPDFNHRCVIYPRGGELMRRIDPPTDSDRKLLDKLSATAAMCYPHHCTYDLIDPGKEWNVEVCSSWRVVLEESDFSLKKLKAGARFGFIGSSDAHRANPGLGGALTGVYAETLSPESLFDAYRNRRLVASQGFAIFIDFRVDGVFIGGESTRPTGAAPEVRATVEAPDDIEYVQVLRDADVVFENRPRSRKAVFSFADTAIPAGRHFYILKVKLEGDPALNFDAGARSDESFTTKSRYPHNLAKARGVFAWTSPIWIVAGPSKPDGVNSG